MRSRQFVHELIPFRERDHLRPYKLCKEIAGADDRQSGPQAVRLLDGAPVIDEQGAAAVYRDSYGRAFAATEPAAGDQLCEKRKLGWLIGGDDIEVALHHRVLKPGDLSGEVAGDLSFDIGRHSQTESGQQFGPLQFEKIDED